jgi:4-hydroxybenzoate polyprenyltransferase
LVAGVLALCALLLIIGLNRLTWVLAVLAACIAASYPFTKRFFALPQAYLGVAFGFGIPMAFAAVLDRLPLAAWVLLLTNVFWAIAYDTEYAMVDRDDVAAIMLCYGLTLAGLIAVGVLVERGPFFAAGIFVAAGIAIYHYVLIRTREPARCFRAFLNNNWLGGAVFVGLALDYALS